jgi:hypothetical protein
MGNQVQVGHIGCNHRKLPEIVAIERQQMVTP